MNTNEIITANKMCALIPQDCDSCPYVKTTDCVNVMANDTVDLINHQKDEIEGLIVAQETLLKHIAKLNKELERANATIDRLNMKGDTK